MREVSRLRLGVAALITAGLVGAAGAVQASAAPSACRLVHPAEPAPRQDHGHVISFQSVRSPGFTPPAAAQLVRLTRSAYGRV